MSSAHPVKSSRSLRSRSASRAGRSQRSEWPLLRQQRPSPRGHVLAPWPTPGSLVQKVRNSSIFLSGPSHLSNVDDPIAVALQRSRPGFPKSSRQECRGYGLRCGNWTWTILDLFRSCEQGSLRPPGRSPSGTVRHRRRFRTEETPLGDVCADAKRPNCAYA
jgi:hypothetical protein